MSSDRAVVESYYRVAGDLTASEDALAALLHPDVRVVEHPNPITPRGAVRTREEVLAGFRSSRGLLADQEFRVDELLDTGGRVAVRAYWRATVGVDRGPLVKGTVLEAHIASFLTVDDGRIRDQQTYDCYSPSGA